MHAGGEGSDQIPSLHLSCSWPTSTKPGSQMKVPVQLASSPEPETWPLGSSGAVHSAENRKQLENRKQGQWGSSGAERRERDRDSSDGLF